MITDISITSGVVTTTTDITTTGTTIDILQQPLTDLSAQQLGFSVLLMILVVILFCLAFKKF